MRGDEYVHPLLSSKWVLHPGLGFHIGMSWTMLFNTVQAFIQTCQSINATSSEGTEGSEEAEEWTSKVQDPLSEHLIINRMGKKWRSRYASFDTDCQARVRSNTTSVCEYAWIPSHITNVSSEDRLAHAIEPYIVESANWNITNGGIFAVKTGAYLKLRYQNLTQPSNAIFLMYIRSNQQEFDESKIVVHTEVHTTEEAVRSGVPVTLEGHHEPWSTVFYSKVIDLAKSRALPGDSMKVTFQLVEGQYFHLKGVAICNL
jgi:hypothetical protein